jgi:hypothetical protein
MLSTAPVKLSVAQLPISQRVGSDGTSWQPLWYWAYHHERGEGAEALLGRFLGQPNRRAGGVGRTT